MNPAVIVLPIAAGLAAWALSRSRAQAADSPEQGEPEAPGLPSSPTSPDWPSSPTSPSWPSSPAPSSPAPGLPSSPEATRSPVAAAQALFDYVSAAISAGRSASLGSKGSPNAIVRDAQADMGDVAIDGIYGTATRTRGKQLLGKSFPARAAATAPSSPKPPSSPNPPSSSSSSNTTPELRSEPVTLDEPATPPRPGRARLERGASYRATLALTGMNALASNDQVAAVLQEKVGPWTGLRVTGSGSTRKATGTYAGAARDVELPPEVQELVRVATPKASPAPQPAAPQPAKPKPAAPQPAAPQPAKPKPAKPKPATTAAPAPEPATRSPVAAAQALFDYVSAAIKGGRGSSLGTKTSPNAIVRDAQADMGELTSDGIYGPATRTRGKQLLGKTFPART